ncbi:FAD-dependent thymidylate synthase [Picosynechococcus sp. PCC 11901]|uniref:FAD-dependent thymidylate synthase n=1 Tax=unclassified Picosynechococcus TaxID=3079910 RepID=UPI0004AAD5CD|nr:MULTISPECIES: FAD-dependent thymidylate synthase [unclassified Picosynechococcus]QCS49877.1 FAD-dependent thymidylate synthase [Picosynechococcus sp. PCC 11901]
MDKFRVEVLRSTPNPQQTIWSAMHQDYCEEFVWEQQSNFPDEQKAGELIVKHLLAGGRGHYGPLEHPQIVFNVGYFPHSMMQQIRTHRVGVSFDVQCLAGDTEITFVQASGSLRKIKISDLHDLWHNGEKAIRERKIRGRKGEQPGFYRRDCKTRLRKMSLRVLNEDTGNFEIGHLQDVMSSGEQPVYRLTLADGKTLDCTVNHRLYTTQGWQRMGEALGLMTDEDHQVLAVTKTCEVMTNGVVRPDALYSQQSWLAAQVKQGLTAQQIAIICDCSPDVIRHWAKKFQLKLPAGHRQHLEIVVNNSRRNDRVCSQKLLRFQIESKDSGPRLKAHPVKVVAVEYLGIQPTYDLEVQGPWHNFVANGVVVHNSFRYTGQRIIDVAEGKRDVEEVFYLRPVGKYDNRQGKKYFYSEEQRQADKEWCLAACDRYRQRIEEGLAEEHARSLIPFDARQHFVMSCNVRSLMHLLDLRWKKDAQLEAQQLCELLFVHFETWCPEIAAWYHKNRAQKARLSP